MKTIIGTHQSGASINIRQESETYFWVEVTCIKGYVRHRDWYPNLPFAKKEGRFHAHDYEETVTGLNKGRWKWNEQ